MEVGGFEPSIKPGHKYAVALPYSKGDGVVCGVSILQTYPTIEALQSGFDTISAYAKERGLSSPVKIEILDEKMNCRILSDGTAVKN